MSGNPSAPDYPGGGGGGAIGGGGGGTDDCNLHFRTQLASPRPTVVAGLAPGGVLIIDLRENGGVRVIAAVTDTDDIAGSIVDNVHRLLACIQAGHNYQATVIAVAGGAVTLDIERRA